MKGLLNTFLANFLRLGTDCRPTTGGGVISKALAIWWVSFGFFGAGVTVTSSSKPPAAATDSMFMRFKASLKPVLARETWRRAMFESRCRNSNSVWIDMFESEDKGAVMVFYMSLLPNAMGITKRVGTLQKLRLLGTLKSLKPLEEKTLQVVTLPWKLKHEEASALQLPANGWCIGHGIFNSDLFHSILQQITENQEHIFIFLDFDCPILRSKRTITANQVLVLGLLFRKPVVEVFHGCEGAENILPIGIQSIAAVKQVILDHRMPWMNSRLSLLRVSFPKTILHPILETWYFNLILQINSVKFLKEKTKVLVNVFIETHQCSQNLI